MKYLHVRSDGTRVINDDSFDPFPFDPKKGVTTYDIDFMNKKAEEYKERLLKLIAERPSRLCRFVKK